VSYVSGILKDKVNHLFCFFRGKINDFTMKLMVSQTVKGGFFSCGRRGRRLQLFKVGRSAVVVTDPGLIPAASPLPVLQAEGQTADIVFFIPTFEASLQTGNPLPFYCQQHVFIFTEYGCLLFIISWRDDRSGITAVH